MGDKTPATTTTQSSSQPWSAATPLLTDLISKYGGMDTSVTPGQSTALGNLNSSAAGIPNFGSTAATGVNRLFDSDTSPQVGMLGQGYDALKANLGATASGANLDPFKTPGFGDAINTGIQDATNAVKGVYAGSGRDPSGAGSFAQSLGRGITQGISPTIAAQANQNTSNMMNANSTLFNAGNTTATGQASLGQLPLSNILQGLQGAGMISGLYTAPAAAQVGAANASQQQPFANMQSLLTPALGLGALGTQTTGTGTSTPANNPLNNWIGGLGAAAGTAGMLFSDRNLKENERTEAVLPSGLPVKSFTMKHDPFKRRQIGLIAQDVEKRDPESVRKVGRFKAVNYPRAMQVGMLNPRKAA